MKISQKKFEAANIRNALKHLTIATLLWSICTSSIAATIHVYSKEIPWKDTTIVTEPGKVYSINTAIALASAGQDIIVHEGVYREKVSIIRSNLHISNFENDYVLVTGCEKVTDWVSASGMAPGVMVADVSKFTIETGYAQFFSNGKAEMMARFPNNTTGKMMEPMDNKSGYSLLTEIKKDDGADANCYATFQSTLPSIDLTGSIIRILSGKNRNYAFGKVTAQSGNTVTFKGLNNGPWSNAAAIASTYHKVSWGFITGKNTIDIPGEWFLEGKKLYYLPNGNNSNQRLELQVRAKVLEVTSVSGVSIKGLNFVGGNATISNTTDFIAENCSWRNLQPFWVPTGYGDNDTDDTGIVMSGNTNSVFKSCYAGHSWGSMFALSSGSNYTFENCIIEDFGWIGIFTSAIYAMSGLISVKNCTFGDAGRFHLRILNDFKMEVYDSEFHDAMKMGEDAGSIEATSTGDLLPLNLKGSIFAYNKIHDCQGIPVFDGSYAKAYVLAFYMEDTENYTAHHNLVYNITSNNYTGSLSYTKAGAFLYLGPRFNYMDLPVNFYNNTVWNYDKSIGIWHIEADNWQALGMAHTGGAMEKGHFANNIFMSNTSFGLNWTKQVLTSTGGQVSTVKVTNPPSIETNDFTTFTNHCATIGYQFNPQNNLSIAQSSQTTEFQNTTIGDFSLKSAAKSKGAGVVIDGITSTPIPDCGAFEGGNRVLSAGSTLKTPTWAETLTPQTSITGWRFPKLNLFPNPANQTLQISGLGSTPNKIKYMITDISGKKVLQGELNNRSEPHSVNIEGLSQGVYFIEIKTTISYKSGFIKQ